MGYFGLLETQTMQYENKFGEFLIPIPSENKINENLIAFAKKFCKRQGKKTFIFFLKYFKKQIRRKHVFGL